MKRIQVSSDQITWYDIPANTADISVDGDSLDDTTFQNEGYKSTITGLFDWSVSTNAMWKGAAGYCAKILKSVGQTSFMEESMTHEGNGVYSIDDSSKTPWVPDSLTVFVNGNPVEPLDLELMFGKVILSTSTGTVTISGSHFNLQETASTNQYQLAQAADVFDITDFQNACFSGGFKFFQPGLLGVSLDVSGFNNPSAEYYQGLRNREIVVIELQPQGGAVVRGLFRANGYNQASSVGEKETENVIYSLTVPDKGSPFAWQFGDLAQGTRLVVEKWLARESLFVRYLPDGITGVGRVGKSFVADVSLEGSVDGLNTFSINLQGSGRLRLTTPSLLILYLDDDENTLDILVKPQAYVEDDAESLTILYSADAEDANSVTITIG